jgi:hypothetical protein
LQKDNDWLATCCQIPGSPPDSNTGMDPFHDQSVLCHHVGNGPIFDQFMPYPKRGRRTTDVGLAVRCRRRGKTTRSNTGIDTDTNLLTCTRIVLTNSFNLRYRTALDGTQ